MASTSSAGFQDSPHICGERDFYSRHIQDYEEKESHKDKSLKTHVEEVLKTSNKLYAFCGFDDPVLQEMGHYLAYYHDLGKLDPAWRIGKAHKPNHSPMSVEALFQNKVYFNTDRELTSLLWYLILRHHGRLVAPAKTPSDSNALRTVKNLSEFWYNGHSEALSLIDVSDIFGLFKIADVLSANKHSPREHRGTERLMMKRPTYTTDMVRQLILSGSFLEERWEKQLQIKTLPSVGMLRAPTGWGKTSVSLLFSSDKPCNRFFYLLPTITAINQFYNKLHSAFGSDVSKYFYFYDTEIKEEEEKMQTLFFIQSFLSPIVITTVDQFLLSFLQCGKYFTKRVSFRGCALVIDEVHLLNPAMLMILTFLLRTYLTKYRMKCLLMSATFPKAYIAYFSEQLHIPKEALLDFGGEYRQKKRVKFSLHTQDISTNASGIYQDYKSGKRVLVVVNTVEKAVNLGKALRENFCKKSQRKAVVVLHARFMYKHRKEKETLIEKREKAKTPNILIATQVCEVSLDISYDVLHTELAPLGSLVQRFGRVNRQGTFAPWTNVHIYTPQEMHDSERRSRYPYEEWELEESMKVLNDLEGDKLQDEGQLLDRFDEIFSSSDLEEKIDEASSKFNLAVWEDLLKYFCSLDVAEDELKDLLEYRDIFTTLVIPAPEMIAEKDDPKYEELRSDMQEFRKMTRKVGKLSFNERRKMVAVAKEISIPIPIWWIRNRVEERVFPIVCLSDRVYDPYYGLVSHSGSQII